MDQPTRIDLLELDIDLRLADLWREAADVTEWNLEVVSAFMRAAYGKGYCDAFTEDSPGSLCHDHGYEIPGQHAPCAPRRHHGLRRRRGLRAARRAGILSGWPGSVLRHGSSSPSRSQRCSQCSSSTPRSQVAERRRVKPSQLAGQTGTVSLVGTVVGKPTGDSHAAGLRFRLRDVKDPRRSGRGRLHGQRPRPLRRPAVTSSSTASSGTARSSRRPARW